MNSRYSVVGVATMIFGIFMLAGFAPLGIALIVLALIIQSNHKSRYVISSESRYDKATEKQDAQRATTMRSMRS